MNSCGCLAVFCFIQTTHATFEWIFAVWQLGVHYGRYICASWSDTMFLQGDAGTREPKGRKMRATNISQLHHTCVVSRLERSISLRGSKVVRTFYFQSVACQLSKKYESSYFYSRNIWIQIEEVACNS